MSLILQSSQVVENPIRYRPNLISDLVAELDMGVFSELADNASISDLIMRGEGSPADRRYNIKSSAWGFPTLLKTGGPKGGPAMNFASLQQIANVTGNTTLPLTPQPITRAFRLYLPSFANISGSGSGFTRGITSTALQTIQMFTGDRRLVVNAGATTVLGDVVLPLTEWFTLIVCFNGANSFAKLNKNYPVTFSTGDHQYNGEVFGGTLNPSVTESQPFRMDRYSRWFRALSFDDAAAWAQHFSPA